MGPTDSFMCAASAVCDGVRNATVLVWFPLPMETNNTGKGGTYWLHTIRTDLLSWTVVAHL